MASLVNSEHFILRPADDLLQQHPQLQQLSKQLAKTYADNKTIVTEEQLQTIGSALWGALNADDALTAYHQQHNAQSITPIVIASDNPAIQQLPWETLYHPQHGFLGKHQAYTLSRCLPQSISYSHTPLTGPLKIVLFTAMTEDQHRLRVEDEQANVQEALMPWIEKGIVSLTMPNDGRFSTFKKMLRDSEPHVLFMSGHGSFNANTFTEKEAESQFLFEAEEGLSSNAVNQQAIANALYGIAVECIVLSACESGKASSESLSTGLMTHLASRGIPHVIGMRESIFDTAGIQFARHFCDAIGKQERVDIALQTARQSISQRFTGGYKEQRDLLLDAISQTQWCLPALFSHTPERALINWQFQPQPPKIESLTRHETINGIPLAKRFIGRRLQLRELALKFNRSGYQQLHITGAGGQGKTALAAELVQQLQSAGKQVIAWTAKDDNTWDDFLFETELLLNKEQKETFNYFSSRYDDESRRAKKRFQLLSEKFPQGIVFFLDNLESLQDISTRQLTDQNLVAWLQQLNALKLPTIIVITTSRWALNKLDKEDHLKLAQLSYNDYLQLARQTELPTTLLHDRDYLRHIHQLLHGNARALSFFIAAVKRMNAKEQQQFEQALQQAQTESQQDMVLQAVIEHRSEEEKTLLQRMMAYQIPVAKEGIMRLALDLDQLGLIALDQLVAVSLVEKSWEYDLQTNEYYCSPVVSDWLKAQGKTADKKYFMVAADYQFYVLQYQRQTFEQAKISYQAFLRANRRQQAHRVVLDEIIDRLRLAGSYQKVVEHWLPELCQSDDLNIKGEALGHTGKQYLHLGDFKTAQNYLKQSLAIQREIGNKRMEGAILNNISQTYDVQGDYKEALSYLKQALAIQQKISDKSGESTTLNNIATIAYARSDYEIALDYFEQSLAIIQDIVDKENEGKTLNNISQVYHERGDYKTALRYLERSLIIRQEIGDKSGEGTTLNNISRIYQVYGDYTTALSYLERALAIQQEVGNKLAEGTALSNISQIFKTHGDYASALSYLEKSLTIQLETGNKAGESIVLGRISSIHVACGNYKTALSHFEQSLFIQREINDKLMEGRTLSNISGIYQLNGDYKTALSYLEQAIVLQKEIGDKLGKIATLNNIATIIYKLGDYETALSYFEQVLVFQKEMNDKSGEGTTLNNISQIYSAHDNYGTALSYLKQSLDIRQEIGDKCGEGATLHNISLIYSARGDSTTALRYLNKSFVIQRDISDRAGLCNTLFNMGHIYVENGEINKAFETWLTSYQIAKTINLAQILEALENLAPKIGLEGGLAGWEKLAQQMQVNNPIHPE